MKKVEIYTRWAEWEHAVLFKVEDPTACQETVRKRQQEVDDDQDEADLVASYCREKLRSVKQDPDTCNIFIRTGEICEWVCDATGDRISNTRVTPYLKALSIPELVYTKRTGRPGWKWRGAKSKKGEPLVMYADIKYP